MSDRVSSRLYIGTSGWSYPKGAGTWDGVFYPPKLADRDKLTFYANYFNTVEINSSFYRPPAASSARQWAERVPDEFRFTAKLWQKFTHPKMFEDATGQEWRVQDADFDIFAEGIAPLIDAGKLGPLLAQFPASFRPTDTAIAYLEQLVRRIRDADFPLAIELRHRDWTEGEPAVPVRTFLEDYGVAWTMIDEPRFKTSIRHIPVTATVAYFRFHGRNYQSWWRHGESEDRYNYLYTTDEQRHIAAEVQEIATRSDEMYAFYNNHYGAKAVINALQLETALGRPIAQPLPQPLVETYPNLTATLTGRA
ncbi:MAG: DUF72 domain-containing protein [Chloroflexota bacterium]